MSKTISRYPVTHSSDFSTFVKRNQASYRKFLPVERGTTYHSVRVTKRTERKSERGRERLGRTPECAPRNAPSSYISRLFRRRKRFDRTHLVSVGRTDIYLCIRNFFRGPRKIDFVRSQVSGSSETRKTRRHSRGDSAREAESARASPVLHVTTRRTAPHCTAVLHPDRTCGPASLLGPFAGPRCLPSETCPSNSPRAVSLVLSAC